MIWLIPIGGKGTRTQALGEFKPFIKILGHEMLTWFMASIKNNISISDSFIFITNKYFISNFEVEERIHVIFKNLNLNNKIRVLAPSQKMPGITAALHESGDILQTNQPVTVICPDQYVDFKLPSSIPPQTGYLTIELDFGKDQGYVDIKEGRITRFVEKEHISNYASNGTFIVSSGKALHNAIEAQIKDKAVSNNGEYCIGPAFNYLIQKGFQILPLLTKARYDLGNITDIENFAYTPLAQGLSRTIISINKYEDETETLSYKPLNSYDSLTRPLF